MKHKIWDEQVKKAKSTNHCGLIRSSDTKMGPSNLVVVLTPLVMSLFLYRKLSFLVWTPLGFHRHPVSWKATENNNSKQRQLVQSYHRTLKMCCHWGKVFKEPSFPLLIDGLSAGCRWVREAPALSHSNLLSWSNLRSLAGSQLVSLR